MSQPKRSLFLNSKKNPAHDSVIERLHSQKFRDQVSATFHLWLPRWPRTDLQRPGSQIDAGTGDALRLEPHKNICAKAVVHVVPDNQTQEELKPLGHAHDTRLHCRGKVTTPLTSLRPGLKS